METTMPAREIGIPLEQLLERHATGEISADIVHDALRRRGQEIVEEFRQRRRQAIHRLAGAGTAFAGGIQ